jgi:hypothetical protein
VVCSAVRPDLLLLDEPTSGLDPLMEREFRRCVAEAREGGQTVFLSSHILSEVESLCDRVAILRAGRLAEIGTLAQLRHLSALTVEVIFDRTPPDLAHVTGVTHVVVDDHRVQLQVQGPIEPLVNALAGTGLRQLLSREPDLEELFLAHYGSRGDAPGPRAAPATAVATPVSSVPSGGYSPRPGCCAGRKSPGARSCCSRARPRAAAPRVSSWRAWPAGWPPCSC